MCKDGVGNWKLLHLRLFVMRPDADNDIVVEYASEKENKEDEKDEDKKEQAEGEKSKQNSWRRHNVKIRRRRG